VNGEGSSKEEYMADLEQRIIDTELECVNLRRMVERIGKEKRTCAVPEKTGWVMYLLVLLVMIDMGLALIALIK